jgi:hypothetical protein
VFYRCGVLDSFGGRTKAFCDLEMGRGWTAKDSGEEGGVFLSRSMYGVEVFVKQHAFSGPRNTTPFL